MIFQVKIQNFQSHKEITLDLHEGVNALVGLTGAGKSVVFKALEWLFRNRPLGEEYRSWWGGDTRVEIILKDTSSDGDGQKVGRIRTGSDNFYYIDKKEFRAFGNGPPPQPILDLLNLSEVNLQMQADPSFLISNSSGEVARYLNKAAHLDVIDQTLANIASTLRKEREDLSQARGDLKRTQEQLVLYDWLPEADKQLVKLEKLQEEVVWLSAQKSELKQIAVSYDKVRTDLTNLNEVLRFESEVRKWIVLSREIETQNARWEQLAAVVDQYEKTEKELKKLGEIEKLRKRVEELLVLTGVISQEREKRNLFFHIVENHGKVTGAFGQAEKEVEKFQKEFDKLMPNRCPLCEQEIKR